MKRVLFVVLAAVLMVGCGKKNSTTDASPNPQPNVERKPGWTQPLLEAYVNSCATNYVGATNNPNGHCNCYIDKMSYEFTPTDMEMMSDGTPGFNRAVQIFSACGV